MASAKPLCTQRCALHAVGGGRLGPPRKARHASPHQMTLLLLTSWPLLCPRQVKAVVVNHGSFVEEDEVWKCIPPLFWPEIPVPWDLNTQ